MAKTAKKAEEKKSLPPIKPTDFGLYPHKVRQFSATVSPNYADCLDDPAIWASVAGQIRIADELRIICDDMSFVAYGIATFAQGSHVRIKITDFHELDKVEDIEMEGDGLEAKLCGTKKWCVRNTKTGETLKENIATQLEAVRELDDYRKALRN